jgi:hypothetical protein
MAQQQLQQSNYDAQLGAQKVSSYNNSMNNLVNPIAQGYAYGGDMGNGLGAEFNSTDVNTFNAGGSHETNPLGGIPQGTNQQGGLNTVEEKEVKIELGRNKSYIFSDRLIYE